MTVPMDHLLPRLAQAPSTAALQVLPEYQRHYAVVQALLDQPERGGDAARPEAQPFYRMIAWNVERGTRLAGLIACLQQDSLLRSSDVLLLTETDRGMARSGNRHVTREIARAMGMYYCFVPSYLNLTKGTEDEAAVDDDNAEALHGNAIVSRYPMDDVQSITLPNGIDKMRGQEKRLGSQRAVVATIHFPQGPLRAVCVHLDAHSSPRFRAHQMRIVLAWLARHDVGLPVLIGGDWNTGTGDATSPRTVVQHLLYHLLLGIQRLRREHYPYPYRRFERALFSALETQGYEYLQWNEPGVCTVHHYIEAFAQSVKWQAWLPGWVFPLARRLVRDTGCCSLKLDWFAGRGLRVATAETTARRDGQRAVGAKVVPGLRHHGRPVSDHDAILVDVLAGSLESCYGAA